MTDVLARPQPRIDHPAELERIVQRIVEQVHPIAIYLFGSRARGEGDADSDYDLMVVLPDERMTQPIREELHGASRGDKIRLEVMATRASAFAWRRYEVGTLEYEVEVDGNQLFPKHGQPFRHSARIGRPTMNVNVVEEWLRRADKDLIAARKCNEGADAVPDQSAYHVQQAAEKLVKGALVAHLTRPRKGHKIEELAPLLPDQFPLKQRFITLEQYSKYAWAHRYPLHDGQEPVPEPAVAEVEDWIDEVAKLKGDFEVWLAAREAAAHD